MSLTAEIRKRRSLRQEFLSTGSKKSLGESPNRVRTTEELAADEIRKGLLKLRKTVQERMSIKRDVQEQLRIADLVNSKSVASSINYFFGRGELSQVVDQTNALSQLTHERRLSALGPGGLNRRRAGFEVRDVHISHYGRICPIETPEGTNIGLISSLAIFAAVDEYGFLLTPYRKVKAEKVTDEVEYLRADEEMRAVFAPPGSVELETGKVKKGLVLARKGGELSHVSSDEVDYIDISPKQIVGVSASLIPFLEHDDANRALMGSNMQRSDMMLRSVLTTDAKRRRELYAAFLCSPHRNLLCFLLRDGRGNCISLVFDQAVLFSDLPLGRHQNPDRCTSDRNLDYGE